MFTSAAHEPFQYEEKPQSDRKDLDCSRDLEQKQAEYEQTLYDSDMDFLLM